MYTKNSKEMLLGRRGPVGVQVDYNVVHLRISLVQLFVLLLQNFEKLVQMIELKRFEGAPNGYPFAPLRAGEEDGPPPPPQRIFFPLLFIVIIHARDFHPMQ
jgi:hypothetical protein